MIATYRMIDGQQVSVEFGAMIPTEVASEFVLKTTVGGSRIQFSVDASHREYAFEVAADQRITKNFETTSRYGFRDGTLWAGSGDLLDEQEGVEYWESDGAGRARRQRFHLAAWEGKEYSVHTFRYGGDVEAVTALLSMLEFEEHGDGISCPVPPGVETVTPASIRFRQPGVGIVDVKRVRDVDRIRMPKVAGQRVAGGELFVGSNHGGHDYYVLHGQNMLAYFYPQLDDEEILADWVSEFSIGLASSAN
ncbi:MAG TPA: hypothetical protein ENH15_02110 [Actinobacteria bacterium]|nr:hypothetical protein [Actinomycetota bacterium]